MIKGYSIVAEMIPPSVEIDTFTVCDDAEILPLKERKFGFNPQSEFDFFCFTDRFSRAPARSDNLQLTVSWSFYKYLMGCELRVVFLFKIFCVYGFVTGAEKKKQED
jgi:hypothetical protein